MALTRTLSVAVVGDADSLVRSFRKVDTAAGRSGKNVEHLHVRVRRSFAGMTASAAKMGAGVVAAYASIEGVKGAVDATEELAHTTLTLHKSFGLTIKSASEWGAVAKARGADGKALTMSFKALSTAVRNAHVGSKAQVQAFNELGVSQKQLSAHGNNLKYVLDEVSDGLGHLAPGVDKAAVMAKLFGRTWTTIAPLVRGGSQAMNEQLAVADKYGATLGGKTVTSIEEMIKAQREQKLATLGMQVALGTTLIPTITKVTVAFNKFVLGFREGTGFGGKFHEKLKEVVGDLRPAVQWLVKAATSIGKFVDQHPAVRKLAEGIVAVGLAIKGLKFAAAITGFSDLVAAGRVAAAKLAAIFAAEGAAGAGAGAAEGAAAGGLFASITGAAVTFGRTWGFKFLKGLGGVGIASAIAQMIGVSNADPFSAFHPDSAGGPLDTVGRLPRSQSQVIPFLKQAGGRYGVNVSSTTQGVHAKNSYHYKGEAVDFTGTPAQLKKLYNYLKNTYGPQLAELIYTPGGQGIKNGKPFTYSKALQQEHMGHLHAAIDPARYLKTLGKSPATSTPGSATGIITAAAQKYGIDPAILWGVYGQESNYGKNKSTSSAGAVGPFQLMQATARALGVKDPRNLKQAAYGAAKYLAKYKGRGVAGMLAAYNAGPAGNPNNRETKAYIPGVLAKSKTYAGGGGISDVFGDALPDIPGARPKRQHVSAYELAAAQLAANLAKAQGTPGTADDRAAMLAQRKNISSRIGSVTRALKGKLHKATRLRLTNELADLRGTYTDIGKQLKDLVDDPELITDYEKAVAAAEVAIAKAEGTDGVGDDIAAQVSKRKAVQARIDKIKRALKGHLGGKKRLELTQELADLIGTASDITSTINDLGKSQYSEAGDLIGLKEHAGVLTHEEALGQRKDLAQRMLNGEFGPLSEKERLAAMGDLKDATDELTKATDEANDLARERVDLDRQLIDNQNKILALATQGPEILAAIVAAVSGGIGGKAGLGFQSVGVAGSLARY